jgi:hypothetical protein
MSDFMKIRMLAMIDEELNEVQGSISNNKLWMFAAADAEEVSMCSENLVDLEDYKKVLMKMRVQVNDGTFNISD